MGRLVVVEVGRGKGGGNCKGVGKKGEGKQI